MKIKSRLRWGFAQVARFGNLEDITLSFTSNLGAKRRPRPVALPSEALLDYLAKMAKDLKIFEIPNTQRVARYGIPTSAVADFCSKVPEAFTATPDDRYLTLNDEKTGKSASIEVWREDGDNLVSPRWNPRANAIGAKYAKNVPTTLDGDKYLTHPDLAHVDFTSVEFDIDVVYLWVDGEDPAWIANRAKFMSGSSEKPDLTHSAHSSRFRQADELKYSLRSLSNLPWVRNIFIVTAGQVPEWLDQSNPRVRIVDHSEILPAAALPTFNSHALAANLHKINGLSEHFLYLNDDFFIARHYPKSNMFSSTGAGQVYMTRTLQPGKGAKLAYSASTARRTTIDLANAAGLPTTIGYLQHGPYPMRITLMEQAWKMFPKEMKATTHSRFRSDSDIVPEWLNNFIGYKTGGAQVAGDRPYQYISINSRDALMAILDLLLGYTPAGVFCLNDSSEVGKRLELSSERTARRLNKVLNSYFPNKSEFEK